MATEQEILNRIRRMYGIRAADETVTSTADMEASLRRLRDQVGAPRPADRVTTTTGRSVRGEGTTRPNSGAIREWEQQQAGLGQRITDLENQIARARTRPVQTQDQEADANKEALDRILTGQSRAVLADGQMTLNDRFSGAWRQNRQQVGASGLAGGSADRSARRRLLADLFRGRGRLALGASSAERTARNAIDQRRLELERQVKLGTAPDLDTLNTVSEQRGAVDEAYRGLGQQALGDLLVTGGQTYYTAQEAAGAGRAGPAAFSLTRRRPATTGTYL